MESTTNLYTVVHRADFTTVNFTNNVVGNSKPLRVVEAFGLKDTGATNIFDGGIFTISDSDMSTSNRPGRIVYINTLPPLTNGFQYFQFNNSTFRHLSWTNPISVDVISSESNILAFNGVVKAMDLQ